MAVAAVISGVSSVIGGLGSFGGDPSHGDAANQERFAQNSTAYNLVLARNSHSASALKYLKARAGRGNEFVPVLPGLPNTGQIIGAWGTSEGKADADQKYQKAASFAGTQLEGMAPTVPGTSDSTASKVGNFLDAAGNILIGAGEATANLPGAADEFATAKDKAATALQVGKTVMIVGGIALVAFLAYRAFKR